MCLYQFYFIKTDHLQTTILVFILMKFELSCYGSYGHVMGGCGRVKYVDPTQIHTTDTSDIQCWYQGGGIPKLANLNVW